MSGSLSPIQISLVKPIGPGGNRAEKWLLKQLLYTCAHSRRPVFVFQYVHSVSCSPGELIKRGFWFPTADPPSTTTAAVVGYNNTTAGLSNIVHTHKYLEEERKAHCSGVKLKVTILTLRGSMNPETLTVSYTIKCNQLNSFLRFNNSQYFRKELIVDPINSPE